MTPAQVISALDELTPNSYDFQQKLVWLARVEAALAREVLFTEPPALAPDSRLLAPAPYDELYLRYLQAQIHLEAGEITRCNNAMSLYNTALAGLRRHCIRSQVTDHPCLAGF